MGWIVWSGLVSLISFLDGENLPVGSSTPLLLKPTTYWSASLTSGLPTEKRMQWYENSVLMCDIIRLAPEQQCTTPRAGWFIWLTGVDCLEEVRTQSHQSLCVETRISTRTKTNQSATVEIKNQTLSDIYCSVFHWHLAVRKARYKPVQSTSQSILFFSELEPCK